MSGRLTKIDNNIIDLDVNNNQGINSVDNTIAANDFFQIIVNGRGVLFTLCVPLENGNK